MVRETQSIDLERRSPEEELADRIRQQAAIANLGLRALSGLSVDDLLAEAGRVVADTLRADGIGILEMTPNEDQFAVRLGYGWREEVVGEVVPAPAGGSLRYILNAGEPVVSHDLFAERRFRPSPLLLEHEIRSLCGVVIQSSTGPFGVIGAHARRLGAFSSSDAAFLQSVANLVGEGIARSRSEDTMRLAFEREREAVERLQSLNEMKNSFLEAVSHELRTPLAAVLGFALTLREHSSDLSQSESEMMMERLVANARKLDRLLRDLLDLDRLYRRAILPSRRPADVCEIVRTAVGGVDLGDRSVFVPAGSCPAMVDAPKVERIVENLVVNATRHTPDGTTIWIVVERTAEGIMIVVEDSGPGVPVELKSAVFDVFRRGDATRKNVPGTGIGLSLVRRFAEMHDGRVWVEDRPGGGARFCVVLADAAPAAA